MKTITLSRDQINAHTLCGFWLFSIKSKQYKNIQEIAFFVITSWFIIEFFIHSFSMNGLYYEKPMPTPTNANFKWVLIMQYVNKEKKNHFINPGIYVLHY
jgi:hypothetical protein